VCLMHSLVEVVVSLIGETARNRFIQIDIQRGMYIDI